MKVSPAAPEGAPKLIFAALDAKGQAALEQDIVKLLAELNVAGADSLVVPGEYLEIVITKRQEKS